jgi:hypothetical protein
MLPALEIGKYYLQEEISTYCSQRISGFFYNHLKSLEITAILGSSHDLRREFFY